jgi:anti-sigma B factor antagonist
MQEQPFPVEVFQNRDSRPPTFEVEREEGEAADVVVLRLLGEHDLGSADDLNRRLRVLARLGERVVVDISQTDFLDSTIIHSLLDADRRLQEDGRRLVLRYGTTSVVRRVVEISGLLNFIPHAERRDEAIRLARELT